MNRSTGPKPDVDWDALDEPEPSSGDLSATEPREGSAPTEKQKVASGELPASQRATGPIAPPERSGSLIHPATGELVDPADASDATLADFVSAVRDWEESAKLAKRIAATELHRRMDAEANWTQRAAGWVIRGESPDRWEYDIDELRKVTDELVRQGKITLEARQAAIKEEVVYKPASAGINKLLKLGGEVAARVKQCRHRKPTESRRITVSRES